MFAVSRGCSLPAVHRLLITVASLVAEQGLWDVSASVVAPRLGALWHVGSSWARN